MKYELIIETDGKEKPAELYKRARLVFDKVAHIKRITFGEAITAQERTNSLIEKMQKIIKEYEEESKSI